MGHPGGVVIDGMVTSIPTCERCSGRNQPDSAGLGELFRPRPLKPVLPIRSALGGAEGTASQRARNRQGFGWERWSTQWLYDTLGLFNGYQVRLALRKALSA
jgi:hypothetical protein